MPVSRSMTKGPEKTGPGSITRETTIGGVNPAATWTAEGDIPRRSLPVLMDPAMIAIRFSRHLVGAIAVATLLACRQTGQAEASRQMARRAAELDRLSRQAGTAGLPPVRILIPVGGHDGDPPAGARRGSRDLRSILQGRIKVARHSTGPPWTRRGHALAMAEEPPAKAWFPGSGGTAAGNPKAAAPFWSDQALPLVIIPTWLFSTFENSGSAKVAPPATEYRAVR